MERPWNPELALDDESAHAILLRAFPEFADAKFERLGDGWDNTAFLLTRNGESWVFRFPRRALAAPLIEQENALLPRIASHLPVPIPVPVFVGTAAETYPWTFAGYRVLSGETACRRNLDETARAALAPAIGRFLRALHDIDVTPLRALGLPPDRIARLDPAVRLPQMEERLASAHRSGLVESPNAILRAAASVDVERSPRTDILVHGDLYARHLLVGDEGTLTGVIDWGDVHAGDPAQDLGLVLGFLPQSALGTFLAEYGEVDDATWRFARMRALFLATAILVYGADVGDEALVREGQMGLRLAMP